MSLFAYSEDFILMYDGGYVRYMVYDLVEAAINKYKREGPITLVKSVPPFMKGKVYKSVFTKENSEFHYQLTKKDGVKKRWRMIKPYLDENSSILDVGCNAALFPKLASEENMFAVGIDKNSGTVSDSITYHGTARDFGIINRTIDPATIQSLPKFDYILVFSIYHHLYKEYGDDGAKSILEGLLEKTEKTLFFEPASTTDEYDDSELPFENNDKDSIVNYNVEMLEGITSEKENVRYIGSRSQGTKGERHIFSISKS